jgi:hypothetical protein
LDTPKVSIIVDNYNRSYLLPFIMRAYTYQAEPVPAEMIIIDDESDPQDHFCDFVRNGIEIIKPFFKVRAFKAYGTTRNAGQVLNIGVKQSTGEILVLNHSDMVPATPNVLMRIIEWHKGPKNLYLTPKLVCTHPDFTIRSDVTLPQGVSISRELFYKIGGYDERFKGYGPEDVDISYRIIHGMMDINSRRLEAENIVYMHLEQAKIPIRDGFLHKDENEHLLFENDRNRVWVVNPHGWGICPRLEEIEISN